MGNSKTARVGGFLLAVLCGHVLAQTCGGRPPNVIVIMLDDLGYHDLSINGSEDVRSPNIDKLLRDGCIFTEGYSVAGFCSPARAGFFTSIHPYHSGHQRNPARDDKDTLSGLPLHLTTLPETLRAKGYKSAMIGKWHLGVFAGGDPLSRGFDYFMGFLGSGFPYFEYRKPFRKAFEYIFEQYKIFKGVTYLTDNFTAAAMKFMTKNKNKPFFITLAYNAVHGPYDYKESDVDPWVSEDRVPHVAMIKAVDRGVAKLRRRIDQLGLTKCTMIGFTNDNGGHANGAINFPYFGFKGPLWEGGIRVPISFTYPGVIAKGQVSNKLASLIDFYPTIEAVAKIPASKRNKDAEGVNLLPYMRRVGEKEPRKKGATRPALFNRKVQKAIVRKGKWKLWLDIRKKGGKYPKPTAMYDLVNDAAERNDLLSSQNDRAAAMRALYIEWDKKTVDPIFSGKFRELPLRVKLSTFPRKPVPVNKPITFKSSASRTDGIKVDSQHWEVFRPERIFHADYKDLPIEKDKFIVSKPTKKETTITFKVKGTWVVRINYKSREWVNWKDATVTVQ